MKWDGQNDLSKHMVKDHFIVETKLSVKRDVICNLKKKFVHIKQIKKLASFSAQFSILICFELKKSRITWCL